MANMVETKMETSAMLVKEPSQDAVTANEPTSSASRSRLQQMISEESSSKTAKSRPQQGFGYESSTKTSRSRRPSLRHLSAIDKDMMERAPKGGKTTVRHEDEKGLGGCRMQ